MSSVIGIERPLLSLVGQRQFHLSSHLAILSFVVSFGGSKAVSNLVAGRFADRYGRRRMLLVGWSIGLVEPILIAFAPSWSWVVAANLLLGALKGGQ